MRLENPVRDAVERLVKTTVRDEIAKAFFAGAAAATANLTVYGKPITKTTKKTIKKKMSKKTKQTKGAYAPWRPGGPGRPPNWYINSKNK